MSTPEIAHVLFMDLVGYSKLPMREQTQCIDQLTAAVRATAEFKSAQDKDELLSLPTGDGMALVFFGDPEGPVRCAIEIARLLASLPELKLRMGIHSGPVFRNEDINENQNVAGSAVNIAQRVMSVGGTGHILLSSNAADVLLELGTWAQYLRPLGEVEVKHGARIRLHNLVLADAGNAELPEALQMAGLNSDRDIETVGQDGRTRRSGIRRYLRPPVALPLAVVALTMGLAAYGLFRVDVPSAAPLTSLAVIPFSADSPLANSEQYADAIAESLIKDLSSIQQLQVIAWPSVMQYKQTSMQMEDVAKFLNVDAVLTGAFQSQGNRIDLDLQLLEREKRTNLWTAHYNFPIEETPAVASKIAAEVLSAVGVERPEIAVDAETAPNTLAYENYVQGRFYWNKRTVSGLNEAVAYFQKAIESDPNHALSYAGLADSYLLLAVYNARAPREVIPRAKEAARKALELDPQLAEAYTSLARILGEYEWQHSESESAFKRAIELNPNYATAHHWFGLHLVADGRQDEAYAELQKASRLDPLSVTTIASQALPFYYARQYDRAIEILREAIVVNRESPLPYVLLGQTLAQKGLFEDAIDALERAVALDDAAQTRAILAHAYAVAGKPAQASTILRDLRRQSNAEYVPSYFIAIAYAGLRQNREALAWLERAYQEKSGWLAFAGVEPRFDGLRSEQAFKALLAKLN